MGVEGLLLHHQHLLGQESAVGALNQGVVVVRPLARVARCVVSRQVDGLRSQAYFNMLPGVAIVPLCGQIEREVSVVLRLLVQRVEGGHISQRLSCDAGINHLLNQFLLKTHGKESGLEVAGQELFPQGVDDDFFPLVRHLLRCMSGAGALLHQSGDGADVAIAQSSVNDLVVCRTRFVEAHQQLAVHFSTQAVGLLFRDGLEVGGQQVQQVRHVQHPMLPDVVRTVHGLLQGIDVFRFEQCLAIGRHQGVEVHIGLLLLEAQLVVPPPTDSPQQHHDAHGNDERVDSFLFHLFPFVFFFY